MEYNKIFRPDTLEKLNKRSQENLKKMVGDKTLMQTMISSTKLLQEIMAIEAPYKEQLEALAIQMVEDMYPIILEDNIKLDAKIVSMGDVNQSLDEIKIDKPGQATWEPAYNNSIIGSLSISNSKINNVYKEGDEYLIDIKIYKKLPNNLKHYFKPYISDIYKDQFIFNRNINEIKIDKPLSLKFPIHVKNEEDYKIISKKLSNLGYVFFRSQKPISDINIFKLYGNIINLSNGIILKNSKDKLITWDRYDILNESTPESKRRVINGITQGAALKGTFSFYMFKEYLDAIDDTLVEKYNQLMKEVFGVYDDENAIAMFLQMIAQGQKMGGGSSKVVINEIKIEKPETLNQKKEREFEKLYKKLEEEYPNLHAEILFRKAWNIIDKKYSLDEIKINKPTEVKLKNLQPGKGIKIGEYHLFKNSFGNIITIYDNNSDDEPNPLYQSENIKDIITWLNKPWSINESQQKSPTIQARAICFPMLVHEIIKGLYELVSLQGFSGTKDQNQAVVNKVDKLENEPHDIMRGKYIFEALNNIYVEYYNGNDNRVREFFFSDIYKLNDKEFVDFIENAINEELTPYQISFVKQTIKEIIIDLKTDDYESQQLD